MKALSIFFRRETAVILLALMFATAVCFAMAGGRMVLAARVRHGFWIWNLCLAWLPLVFALVLRELHRSGETRRWKLLGCGALWLLFFPNAPYVFTDLIHLTNFEGQQFWRNLSLGLLCGLTGLVLGFVSLQLVHGVVAERWGRLKGWLFVMGVSGLASSGICLGRFYRANSWDVVFNPGELFGRLSAMMWDWLNHPKTLAVPVLYAVFMFTAYVMLCALGHVPRAHVKSTDNVGMVV